MVLLGLVMTFSSYSASYLLPEDDSQVVGRLQHHVVEKGDTFAKLAKIYDVGLLSLMAANKGIDPFLPDIGTVLTIPTMFILPTEDRSGIVINLAELRLYYFDDDKKQVHIFPVGIGRIGRDTPEMSSYINEKIPNPTWTPPKSIRDEYLEKGIELPKVVPAGPDNPLGEYALRLAYGVGDYLIHGTNRDFGIGLRVSSGCIRMEPVDIKWLFEQVSRKDRVRVVNIPIKVSLEPDRSVFMEVHEPLTNSDGVQEPLVMPQELQWWMMEFDISMNKARAAMIVQSGVPIEIAAPSL
ncbi:peptidase [Vibrio sp. MACH09]|nr:peptidase [Vibrio sp. MACH09]